MTPAQLFWKIDEIAAATHGQPHSDAAATSITGISIDSRDTMPGDLFVALPGTASDGHKFLPAAMALSRLTISMAAGQAAMMAARMLAASSVRGLSSVTNTWSAPVLAMCPISARFPASRSPPQPNKTTSLLVAAGRSAASAAANASGVCA